MKPRVHVKEAAKKSSFLSGRGEGLNGCATKEKRTFLNVRKKVPMATKPRGGTKRQYGVRVWGHGFI